jgi:isopentenyl diphosphate isomerase/L-lactate dehydrogenase-like FMN-dependent dehydrogenase
MENEMSTDPHLINLFDFEDCAKERLPKEEYDYIAGGATDEISIDRNRRAYASWAFRPRVLRDVSKLDLSTTVLGTKVNLPVLIAPCGGHKRAHPEGELATYRAATAHGTVLAVSANSNTSFEDLANSTKGHLWVQMYPFRDKEMTKDWLKRARDNGYEAVVVTLDSQWPPKRERNIRNNYRRTRGVNYPKSGRTRRRRLRSRGHLAGFGMDQKGGRSPGGRQRGYDRRRRRTMRRGWRRRRDRFQSRRAAPR